ncbi:acyl carrier protein [Nostoc sphaeroides]|uniref:Polyketide synthase n=1 Tax=Nostoc sphaeroides CCNUC1 TaxID=2653204 RepID=A0A5P8WBR5_9NOSO|nr:acyl carrier protein [Nostoc sphaeroides]MCC5632194.1 acyl carrier protein [Nostoc sphaeroides CHAB 2801]QFS50120.1 polyketide synthase [Nostoc sphaeroides CCNUC1]
MNQHITISNDAHSQSVETIQVWLVAQFAERLEIDSEDIDTSEPFDNYGLNSAETMILLGRLEKWLGRNLSPTLIFNYPTIAELAQRLAEETSVSK